VLARARTRTVYLPFWPVHPPPPPSPFRRAICFSAGRAHGIFNSRISIRARIFPPVDVPARIETNKAVTEIGGAVYDIAPQRSGVSSLDDKSLFTGWLRPKEALNSASVSREASASLIISRSSRSVECRSDNAPLPKNHPGRTVRKGENIFGRFVCVMREQEREGFKGITFLVGSSSEARDVRSLISGRASTSSQSEPSRYVNYRNITVNHSARRGGSYSCRSRVPEDAERGVQHSAKFSLD